MTELVELAGSQDVAVAAADRIVAAVGGVPHAVLGVATGSSPLATYRELGRRAESGVDLGGLHVVQLDEYVGLAAGHPERYGAVVRRELADRIALPHERVHVPDVDASDLDGACAAYEALIRDLGGVDLQILGLGSDGHVAFNMPGSSPASRTRVTALSDRTVQDNARFFGGRTDLVPRAAVTQGLATIHEARSLLMLVTGESKAAALRALLEGPAGPQAPGTALLDHPDLTILADRAALGALRPAGPAALGGARR
ncbi:glucosamine-6-phosphate deaminase [Actinotalea sp. M2MS4P-6]|uniref:glucosamine-6-phosphate deaminase n=1 Tax=Actinotalea sp. M2MS4P-6 TaxID=2983762 RepID=UPI0021E482E1|nr:glucosamine-6-phosphate deaminase [Actinotalea sp. M2MS4P-6]MCV2394953.1 glucosamine-6-phosphate deaminase [Actinotalea sp. M2MS4P-6]